MDKNRIAEILDEMGTLLELKGENPFRARAFHNASVVVAGLVDDIESLVESKSLTSIKGIGESIATIITDLVKTGKSQNYEELKSSFPQGILDLLKLQGLGPKKLKVIYEKLNIKTIDELKKACENQSLRSLEGFGIKTEENILKSIAQLERNIGKHLYPKALESAEKIIKSLTSIDGVINCNYAGSLRRCKELIGDIDIITSADIKFHSKIIESFTKLEEVDTIIAVGSTKASVILKNGIQCDLRVVKELEYPFALNYFTGSKEHNVEIRSLAKKHGLSLNEYGFTLLEGSKIKIPKCKDEKELYNSLGLNYIPSELRENTGEIEFAKSNPIPRLCEIGDLRGTFHCHTTDSDGTNTLEQMVNAAKKIGWEYLGIADHSQAAAYAGGLTQEQAKNQIKKIDSLNKKLKDFRVFSGIECDILSDGSLDFNDELLSEFDYVIVSIHTKFNMTEAEATKRIIKALQNKYTKILAHPTGRLLLEREGYPVNLKEVIDVASDYGKAIEINSHPMRLDLDWRYVRYAKEKKVPIFINPDAHNTEALLDVKYGINVARKGWLEKEDIVNTWTIEKIVEYLGK